MYDIFNANNKIFDQNERVTELMANITKSNLQNRNLLIHLINL